MTSLLLASHIFIFTDEGEEDWLSSTVFWSVVGPLVALLVVLLACLLIFVFCRLHTR